MLIHGLRNTKRILNRLFLMLLFIMVDAHDGTTTLIVLSPPHQSGYFVLLTHLFRNLISLKVLRITTNICKIYLKHFLSQYPEIKHNQIQ